MSASRFFVLLASPEAAASTWVRHEVSWWRDHRDRQTLLIALTDGEVAWDTARNDFDWGRTSALPPLMSGWFDAEPLWVDLRGLRADNLSVRDNGRLRDAVATLAAPIHGKNKDQLESEDRRQRRRLVHVGLAAVATLCLLLIAVTVAGVLAVGAERRARDERRTVAAHLLAATAENELPGQHDRAALVAAEAYRLRQDSRTRSALFRAVTANPYLVGQLALDSDVTALGTASGEPRTVAGTAAGNVVMINSGRAVERILPLGRRPVSSVAVSADGLVVAATDNETVRLWRQGSASPVAVPARGKFSQVAVSPSGRTFAVAGTRGLSVYDAAGRPVARLDVVSSGGGIALPDDSSVILSQWTVARTLALPGLALLRERNLNVPASFGNNAEAAHLSYFTWFKYGVGVVVERFGNAPDGSEDRRAFGWGEHPLVNQLAVSDAGDRVALASGGAIHYLSLGPESSDFSSTVLTGTARVDRMAFMDNPDRLVSTAGRVVTFWDVRQAARIAALSRAFPDGGPVLPTPPRIVLGRTADRILLTVPASVVDVASVKLADRIDVTGVPLWLSDDGRAAMFVEYHGDLVVWRADTGAVAVPPEQGRLPIDRVLAVGRGSEPDQAVVVMESGQVAVVDHAASRPRVSVRAAPGLRPAGGYSGAAISADGHLAALSSSAGVDVVDIRTGRTRPSVRGRATGVTFAGPTVMIVFRDGATADVVAVANDRLTRRMTEVWGDSGSHRPPVASDDGELLADLGDDGLMHVTTLRDGVEIGSFQLPRPGDSLSSNPWDSTDFKFLPGTRVLVTATAGGPVLRWNLDERTWIAAISRDVARNLTLAEWPDEARADRPTDLGRGRPLGGAPPRPVPFSPPAASRRAYLGLTAADGSWDGIVGELNAAAVVRIAAGSPAAAAGIRLDDRVTDVGPFNVFNGQDLLDALAHYRPGDRVDITVERPSVGIFDRGWREETFPVDLR